MAWPSTSMNPVTLTHSTTTFWRVAFAPEDPVRAVLEDDSEIWRVSLSLEDRRVGGAAQHSANTLAMGAMLLRPPQSHLSFSKKRESAVTTPRALWSKRLAITRISLISDNYTMSSVLGGHFQTTPGASQKRQSVTLKKPVKHLGGGGLCNGIVVFI